MVFEIEITVILFRQQFIMQKLRCNYWSSLHWTWVVERLYSRFITALCNRICLSLASTMNQAAVVVATINTDTTASVRDNSMSHGLYLIIQRNLAINFLCSILHVWCNVSDIYTFALFIGENIDYWQENSRGKHRTRWSWQMHEGDNWILQFCVTRERERERERERHKAL